MDFLFFSGACSASGADINAFINGRRAK